jgi:DNA-binding winged helix-turn-helix (wHTH) protein
MRDIINSRLGFGPFEVDLGTRELRKGGVRVKLSGQPLEILSALLEHPGELVTRDELRKRIWSENTFVDFGHGLNAAVNKLREALGDSADDPRYVETLPRRGYRFISAVEELSTAPASIATLAPATLEPHSKASWTKGEWESTLPSKRQTLVQTWALLTLLVLLALGISQFWFAWPASPTVQEAELRAKRAAELTVSDKKGLLSKQTTEDRASSGQRATHPEPVRQNGERVAEPPAPDDSVLLRLERSGGPIKLFDERSVSDGPVILRFDLAHADGLNPVTRLVAGPEAVAGPQPSPDGKKLVFMAGRIDAMEIWVCNSDGSSPKALTNMGRTGTPRWSPDSRSIVFDSDGRYGRSGIYVVSANGGAVRAVVEDQLNNSVPSWSRDGRSIYFASNRGQGSEGEQVWEVPAEGGQPVQVTQQGGFSAYESADGQWLYYAKSRNANPEIWQVPVNGGAEIRVPLLHPSTWASWALTNRGILLLSEYRGHTSELQYFDFASRSIHSVATLEKASFWLSASSDGSSIWYSELTDYQARQVFRAGLD